MFYGVLPTSLMCIFPTDPEVRDMGVTAYGGAATLASYPLLLSVLVAIAST